MIVARKTNLRLGYLIKNTFAVISHTWKYIQTYILNSIFNKMDLSEYTFALFVQTRKLIISRQIKAEVVGLCPNNLIFVLLL